MSYKLGIGELVIGIVCVLFYLRLYILRGKKQREEREAALERRKTGSKGKAPLQTGTSFERPRYQVTSWPLLIAAVIFMCVGLMLFTERIDWLLTYRPYYWIPVSLGGLMFIFCFK